MALALEGTESAALALKRVRYTHDALIDLMIQRPELTQGQLAKEFGYTQAWLSRIVNSDAFNTRLAARRTELVDPEIALTLEEKFKGLADQSMAVIAERLEMTKNPELAIKTLELSAKALGYGARQANVAVQANFVVALPQKAESIDAWGQKYSTAGSVPFIEASQIPEKEA